MRFYLALLISKFYLFVSKCIGKDKSDKAGLLAARIYPDILTRINKPKLVVMVTGTNGKTTISSLITDILRLEGKKVSFNDWGANMLAGHIRCLIDSVNILNKPNKDVAILECDELTTNYTIPAVKPDYVIVTNLCRDSIRRNSYPEYIFNRINTGLNNSVNTKVILNSDDPISSFLGENNEKTFISMNKVVDNAYKNISNDINVCPKCNSIIEYEYRHYRHLGKFYCPNCGLTNYKPDYVIESINDNNIIINGNEYKKLSNNIFNAYNEAMVIVFLEKLGYEIDYIKEVINKVNIPKSRENKEIINGIKVYAQLAKGQNASAVSTVLESLTKKEDKKQIILLLDEDYGNVDAEETIDWLYNTDFELLNSLNLEKVIITGPRYLDYIARFKFAGISDDKVVSFPDYKDVINYVNLDGNSSIYVLYDVDKRPIGEEVYEKIKTRILNEVGK